LIYRRITIKKKNIHLAEAISIIELNSFLEHYQFDNGVIHIDNRKAISIIRKNRGWTKGLEKSLQSKRVDITYLPRRYNIAHRIAYRDRFVKSVLVSDVKRKNLPEDFPNYKLSFELYEELKKSKPQKIIQYHKTQINLNKKIWLGSLLEKGEDYEVYAYYKLRIRVRNRVIVTISKADHVSLISHYKIIKRKRKLSRYNKDR
jgi:hypothetical protein